MGERVEEVFTLQLARAAGRQAQKFLRVRDVRKQDRDDIIAAAMLWCWENRASYSLTTTLETWFMNAVRNSYQSFRRAELPAADESVAALSSGDDPTYDAVEAESSAEALVKALTPEAREVAALIVQGYTRREIMQKGYSHQAVTQTYQRVKQMRKLVPDSKVRSKIRTHVTARASGSDHHEHTPSEIDQELEALEFAPPVGANCPPCWRCMWFEGFLPAGKRSTRLEIEDKEVRQAVLDTEARKIEIANKVRGGQL